MKVLSREGSTQLGHAESTVTLSPLGKSSSSGSGLNKSASSSRISSSLLSSPPSLQQLQIINEDSNSKHVHRLSKHHLVTDFDEELVFLELDYRVCSEFALIQPLELVDVAWQKKDKEKLAPNVSLFFFYIIYLFYFLFLRFP